MRNQSLEKNRETKRAIESLKAFDIFTRSKARVHATKREALPVGYQRGSVRYAFAFAGKEVTATDLRRMYDANQRPALEIAGNEQPAAS